VSRKKSSIYSVEIDVFIGKAIGVNWELPTEFVIKKRRKANHVK
jgi:hypothetical protein